MNEPELIEDFLAQRTLALVGVSRNGEGYGNQIRKDLTAKGYALRVIHPRAEEIEGHPCFPSVASVAGEVGGLVMVTPPASTLTVLVEAHAAGIKRIWMQPGAESAEAVAFCRDHGLALVQGPCVMVESR